MKAFSRNVKLVGLIALVALLQAVPTIAAAPVIRGDGVVVTDEPGGGVRISVDVPSGSLHRLLSQIELFMGVPLRFGSIVDRDVAFRSGPAAPSVVLARLASQEGLELIRVGHGWLVQDLRERRVTIDVKDADVRAILSMLKKQCAIPNLMIDPDVGGKGTFLFHDVPCSVAMKTVLASLGLGMESYSAVTRVTARR